MMHSHGSGRRSQLLEDTVLEVLEDDQLVAAKEHAHLGRRGFSKALSIILWGLRIYVVLMLILVAMQVVQAVH